MKSFFAACVSVLLMATPALAAGDKGSAEEAVALTKKALAHIKTEGPKAYEDFTAKDPRFIDRDLYVIVYDLNGKCLASGSNPKMVGRDNLETQDTDGKFYIKERMELARTSPQGYWQDYKFPNPLTKKVEPKSTYCEVGSGVLACVGIYK